jgi:uncharacterized membrane protein YcaP (DUF421 family)
MILATEMFNPEWFQSVGAAFERIFGGDYPPERLETYQVAARAAVVYLIGLVVVRVGKSRLISRLTALDVILGFILGSLLSRGITGHASISGTAVASAVLVLMHWLFTKLAYHWHAFGTLIKGHVRPLVIDGQLQIDAMQKSNLSEHDVMEELRLHGVDEVSEVARAYKERNGEISVIKRK